MRKLINEAKATLRTEPVADGGTLTVTLVAYTFDSGETEIFLRYHIEYLSHDHTWYENIKAMTTVELRALGD